MPVAPGGNLVAAEEKQKKENRDVKGKLKKGGSKI